LVINLSKKNNANNKGRYKTVIISKGGKDSGHTILLSHDFKAHDAETPD